MTTKTSVNLIDDQGYLPLLPCAQVKIIICNKITRHNCPTKNLPKESFQQWRVVSSINITVLNIVESDPA